MRILRLLKAFLIVSLLAGAPAVAQDEDEGFLTRQLQDLLSGAGRTVDIVGFEGALSSQASMQSMTIADDEGVWLRLEDVVLDWNRSALLRGRLEVEALTAARVDLPRGPVSQAAELPDAEATPFSLPDLPVSINIARFEIAELNLGAALFGEAAQMSVTASARLDDDGLFADVDALRTDGRDGQFDIEATVNQSDNVIDLLLELAEGEDGIVARLLNIPDRPSVLLRIAGAGPLNDFTTDITLATDGEDRLSGQVAIAEIDAASGAQGSDRRVSANIGGDLTALLLPQYREFFGPDVDLEVEAFLQGDGGVDVRQFALNAAAAQLAGQVRLGPDKWPQLVDIEGVIERADGTRVLLPGGDGTFVDRVGLDIAFDAASEDSYSAVFDISGLQTSTLRVEQTQLSSTGTVRTRDDVPRQLDGAITFAATGLSLDNSAVGEALGTEISGDAQLSYVEGSPFSISDLRFAGPDYGLAGDVDIGVGEGVQTRLDARVNADDISRFSALAGRELAGQADVTVAGTVTPLSGAFDLILAGRASDIVTGIAQADAVLAGQTDLNLTARRDETGTFVRDLRLVNAAVEFQGEAALASQDSRITGAATLRDVGLLLPQYSGPVTIDGSALQDARGWTVDVEADGPYGSRARIEGLATGPDAVLDYDLTVPQVSDFVPEIEGPLNATGTLRPTPEGWRIDTQARGPYDADAAVTGLVTGPDLSVDFELSMPQISRVPQIRDAAPQIEGPLNASGNIRQTEQGIVIDAAASGPLGADVSASGLATGPDAAIEFAISMPEVGRIAPQINGPLSAEGLIRQTPQGWALRTTASGPYDARADIDGLVTGPDLSVNFDVAIPNVQPLVPGISGPLNATGRVFQTPQGLAVEASAQGPYASRLGVAGTVTGENPALDFDLSLPDVSPLVPRISGPLDVNGTARQTDQGWQIDTTASGVSGIQAQIAGLVANDGALDLRAQGTLPLGLANPFLAPRILQGQAQFDLGVSGPPSPDSVTGTITVNGASLTAPNIRVALEGIDATVNLSGGRADLDLNGTATQGGQVSVGGSIGLSGGYPADIDVNLADLVVTDPRLYSTRVSGDLAINGPLTGGARIAGQINLGETNVTVPSTGLTSIGEIPMIDHVNAPRDVVATRNRAGLIGEDAGTDPAAGGSRGPGFGLDIAVNAPNRIFVRGRGLDAELGGNLSLTGTTNRIISSGRFDLERGRLDILGQRFDLVEGSIQFQGDLVPYIRFVSATSTNTGEVRIILQGPSDEPEVIFESTPSAPQDEVLARLLFGRNISEISAFQALQLANAVATLAGRNDGGVVSSLRDNFGFDDLDVTTTDEGETALRIGKYLSENIYTDVTAASDGTGEVSLNLDLTDSFKAKGTLGSDGNSRLGIFFERDY